MKQPLLYYKIYVIHNFVCVFKSENDQWVCPQLQKNAKQDLRALFRLHCATKSCLILSILEIFIKRLTKENVFLALN